MKYLILLLLLSGCSSLSQNQSDALKKFASGHNVDIEDLFKSEDQVKKERAEARQQEMQQMALEKAIAPVAGAATKGIADKLNAT